MVTCLFLLSMGKGISEKNPNLCAGENFSHGKLSDDEIYSEFTGSVFRIETTDSETGTGYLIDAERGYVLTAFHVVKSAYPDHSSVRIHATSTAIPDEVLELSIVNRLDSPVDVALLQVHNLGVLKKGHLRAFDVATHFPPTTHYVTIGYPRGKKKPNPQTAELQGRYEGDQTYPADYYLEIKQDIDDGSSGSPLIDDSGAVVAICIYKLHNYSDGLYTPMIYIEDLIKNIPPDSQVEALNQEFKSSPIPSGSVGRLIQKLKWRSGNPSNLELYEWANQVAQDSNHEWIKSYVSCPLIPAYGDRRLSDTDAVLRLSAMGSAAARAQVLRSAADQDLFLGRYQSARAKAEQAVALYQANGDHAGEATAQVVAGRASLYLSNFDDASRVLSQAVAVSGDEGQNARTTLYLAQAYTGLGKPDEASQTVKNTLPYLQASGDDAGLALGFQTLGRADTKRGDYQSAFINFTSSRDYCKKVGDPLCEASTNYWLSKVEQYRGSTTAISKKRKIWMWGLENKSLIGTVALILLTLFLAASRLWSRQR